MRPDVLRRSLRLRLTLGVALPLLLILGIFTAIEYTRHRALVLTNLTTLASHSGQVIESSLRHAMLESDFDEVQTLLDTLGDSEEIQQVYLLDTTGRVIFSPNGDQTGRQLHNELPGCQQCHEQTPADRPDSIVVTDDDGQRVFRSMHPIENSPACEGCHGPDERLLGLLMTDISMAPIEAPLRADFRENLLWWGGTIIVSVGVVNLALSRLVLGRIERLAAAIADFGRDLLAPHPDDEQPDEIGRLAAAFDVMAEQVENRNAENEQLSARLQAQSAQRGELLRRVITAQEDERRRVARELHDEMGQALSGLAMRTEAIADLVRSNPERALEQLDVTRDMLNEATEHMYALILALRPSALDDLGLAVALRTYAERLFEDSSVSFTLDHSQLGPRLPSEIETSLYRVCQEALTNVLRHAGASSVRVTLARKGDSFEGEIRDDGQGFDPASIPANGQSGRGLGLLGMRERVTQCGGTLEVTAEPGKGTRLLIHIPLTGDLPRD